MGERCWCNNMQTLSPLCCACHVLQARQKGTSFVGLRPKRRKALSLMLRCSTICPFFMTSMV